MKRFLSVLFVLFLLLCSHVSYAQDQAEPPNDTPIATVPAEAEMPTPPVSEQNQEDTEVKDPIRDFSVEDLAVQERMAEEKTQLEKSKRLEFFDRIAQISMAVAAWAGVLLLLKTLLYTRDAATAAKETLTEARKVTKIAKIELDGFIEIDEKAHWFVEKIGEKWSILFNHQTVTNVGTGPAIAVEIKWRFTGLADKRYAPSLELAFRIAHVLGEPITEVFIFDPSTF